MSSRKLRTEQIQNKEIGFLMPFELIHRKDRLTHRYFWKCKCRCGKIVERREDYLGRILNGTKHLASCGCQHPRNIKGKNKSQFTGYEDLPGQYLSTLKHRAKFKKMEFDLTAKYLWDLFINQNKSCKLTGLPLNFVFQRQQKRTGLKQSASLDRIDSDKGYIEGNVQWLHKDINKMKQEIPQDKFIELCKLIVQKSSEG